MSKFLVRPSVIARLVVAVALISTLVVVAPSTSSGSALPCVLEPHLKDVSINQGLEYRPLVRGKTTVVRLYLSTPACADPLNDYIELTGAKLTVTPTTTSGVAISPGTEVLAAPNPVEVFPRVTAAAVAPAKDAAGDPKFLIDGKALAPAGHTGDFDLVLTGELQYRAVKNGVATTGTKHVTPADSLKLVARVARQSNPLRVLVVPMGNKADGFTQEFPGGTSTTGDAFKALQNGLMSLSRMFPVADGVSSPMTASGSAGLRFSLVPEVAVDLRPVMTFENGDERFCGSATNFNETIKAQLAVARTNWESQNGTKPDLALGVIWHEVAKGTSGGCAEGFASLSSGEAWVRLVPGAPSITGALMGMEVAHTFGDVPHEHDHDDDARHSPNTRAHATGDRSYDITTGKFISDDRSVMQFRFQPPGWNGDNTLYEQADWKLLHCVFTPQWVGGGCEAPGSGGIAAAGAPALVISGTTNVTDTSDPANDRTDAHSYYESGVARQSDPSSSYTLVQLGAGGQTLKADGVPVRFGVSDHSPNGTSGTSTDGVFDFVTGVADGVARIELRHPARVAPLYARDVNDAPVVVSSSYSSGAGVNASDPGDGDRPALSADGSWLAYRDPAAGIRLRRTGLVTAPTSGFAGSDPAWSPDGKRLAYVTAAGDVYTAPFDPAAGTLGSPSLVYRADLQEELRQVLGSAAASDPSWDPAGRRLAVQVGTASSDIFVLDTHAVPTNGLICRYVALATDGCRPLTSDRLSRTPAWSADNRIAFVRAGQINVTSVTTGITSVTGISGELPAWSDTLLVYAAGGSIWAVNASTFSGATRLTAAADTWPSITRDATKLAVARTTASQTDAVLVDLTRRSIEVTARDENPQQLRLDVFLACPGESLPIVLAARPVAVSGNVATFRTDHDPARVCPNGEVRARVTDGYRIAWTVLGQAPAPAPGNGYPAGAIYRPAEGGKALQYDALAFHGYAIDEQGQVADSRLRWRLLDPTGASRLIGSGARPGVVSPASGGWKPGSYTAVLEIERNGSFTTLTTSSFTILPDEDNDLRPPGTCAENDADPTDAFGDADGDGIPNVDDPSPCASANNATVTFDPQTLYVPSSGNDVMLFVKSTAVDLRAVDPATVRISKVGPWYVDFVAKGWTYDSKSKAWVARFERSSLTQFMSDKGLVSQYVPVVVTGSDGASTFRGFDPKYPYTSKS